MTLENGSGPGPRLTLVDGVLRQLAELAVDHARVGAQELFLAGRQLQGGRAKGEGGGTCSISVGPPLCPGLIPEL